MQHINKCTFCHDTFFYLFVSIIRKNLKGQCHIRFKKISEGLQCWMFIFLWTFNSFLYFLLHGYYFILKLNRILIPANPCLIFWISSITAWKLLQVLWIAAVGLYRNCCKKQLMKSQADMSALVIFLGAENLPNMRLTNKKKENFGQWQLINTVGKHVLHADSIYLVWRTKRNFTSGWRWPEQRRHSRTSLDNYLKLAIEIYPLGNCPNPHCVDDDLALAIEQISCEGFDAVS